jgi:uncharacterized protein (TIGR03437 family)
MGLRWLSGTLFAISASAQLIPSGTPVPITTLPPVVFVNGFQFEGCPSTFADTFGIADQVLQSNGEVSLFFSTCSLPSTATIEDLAGAFASFLSSLQFTNGQPVQTVDVVAHSMGGLVLRSYLSGKQDASGVFQPPAATGVRKAVLLASPNFGTPIASLAGAALLGFTEQLDEMSSGSSFLFGLGTWNDGTDDLRGVDAVAAAGNAGSGGTGNPAGFDDGVVALTSASLQFYLPGRTRVVPYCHIGGGGIVTLFNLCPADAMGIAKIDSAMHDSAQIIVSFLNGTSDWQSVGTAAENDPFLSVDGGVIIAAHNQDDSPEDINFAQVVNGGFPMLSQTLSISSDGIAYSDLVASGSIAVIADGSNTFKLLAGGTQPFLMKLGPQIARIFPAAAANYPLELAPRMIVAIYGTQMTSATVTAGGSPLTLFYSSTTQINALLPDNASGLTPITVQNSGGQNTVNIYVSTAAPAIFTQNSSGNGPASALKASDQSLVTADNPLHAGDFVELYATGLGLTTPMNGLEYAVQQPTVTVGDVACPVTFAGAAPGFSGLDQIDCAIPAGAAPSASSPVVITSGDRMSNTATLAIE